MSLDFKKREFKDPPKDSKPKDSSALSALLNKAPNGLSQIDTSGGSTPDSAGAQLLSPTEAEPPTLQGIPFPTKINNHTNLAKQAGTPLRIPSSSLRRGSYTQSSLQQERDRARASPSSSVLGTSAGYGHLFGAGEIGNVSSPRHYTSTPVSKGFDPSVVEERFIVNVPAALEGTPAKSNLSSMIKEEDQVSSLSRSLSRVSLSRSNSRSSSIISLRRFIEKPWKNEDNNNSVFSPSSLDESPSVRSGRSRKDSSGDELAGSYNSALSFGSTNSQVSTEANLDQLDHQYAQQQSIAGSVGTGNAMRPRAQSLKSFGKLGKTLGEGAGGHVKIIKSSQDNQIYAVKEFRQRHHSETPREYNKKVGAEYCLGLTLKHPNIVNTIDIIYEPDKVYQVMEYCSYDLFAIVMSGKMSNEEVMCDFRQLMNGIHYLHNLGLAHRDLKLDNCVVTDEGIVKIIDFGSSVVFKYPESDKIYDCDGVVGSDPYLAPEAAGKNRYYPPATDIWSAAIVLCCMLMRKFPWKAPRLSDPAFKFFTKVDEDGTRPGLEKLVASLPLESQKLFRGMLDLNPETRYTIEDCWEDPFLHDGEFCTINESGLKAVPGHTHTSVSFEEAHIALLEKKNKRAKKGEKMW